jgi:purine-nucleoside phosphorylase
MAGETWEDVLNWSKQGYFGVEMEASTVFAVSNHFNVPSAAILRIGDNLIEKETVMDINYESSRDLHRQVSQDIFDAAVKELLSS